MSNIVRVTENENGTGRRYAMTEEAYNSKKHAGLGDKTYAEAGYHIFSYEDGTPLDGEPTKHSMSRTSSEIGDVPEGTTGQVSHVDAAYPEGADVATDAPAPAAASPAPVARTGRSMSAPPTPTPAESTES